MQAIPYWASLTVAETGGAGRVGSARLLSDQGPILHHVETRLDAFRAPVRKSGESNAFETPATSIPPFPITHQPHHPSPTCNLSAKYPSLRICIATHWLTGADFVSQLAAAGPRSGGRSSSSSPTRGQFHDRPAIENKSRLLGSKSLEGGRGR